MAGPRGARGLSRPGGWVRGPFAYPRWERVPGWVAARRDPACGGCGSRAKEEAEKGEGGGGEEEAGEGGGGGRGGGGRESSASRRRPGGACRARSRFGSQRRRREARLPGPVRSWPHGAAPARSEVRGLAQRRGRPWAGGRAHRGAGLSHLLAGAKDAQDWEGRSARGQGAGWFPQPPRPGPAVRTTSPAGLTAAAAGRVGSMCMSP